MIEFRREKHVYPLPLRFPVGGNAYDEEGKINHEYITGQYSPMGDFIENQYANNTRSTYLNMSGYVELTLSKIHIHQPDQRDIEPFPTRTILGKPMQRQPSELCGFASRFHHQ